VAEILETMDGESPFLVEGLIHAGPTLLSGAPEAGKTYLALSLARAIVEGDKYWLGRRLHNPGGRVVFGVTDPVSDKEIARRLADYSLACEDVSVIRLHGGMERNDWDALAWEVRKTDARLFVLDNLLGAMPPGKDVNNSSEVRMVTDGLQQLIDNGTAIIILHHTTKGGMGQAKTPLGSRHITAWPRATLTINKVSDSLRRVTFGGNEAACGVLDLEFTPEAETGVWFTVTEKQQRPRRDRSEERQAELREIAAWLRTQAPSDLLAKRGAALARWAHGNAPEGWQKPSEDAWRTAITRELVKGGYL
jgi:hypothetical protein